MVKGINGEVESRLVGCSKRCKSCLDSLARQTFPPQPVLILLTWPSTSSRGLFNVVFPEGPPEYLIDCEYGSGMVASVVKGQGEIFCAGTAEWVVGLIKHEFFTEKITRNVLGRFSSRK